MPRTNRRRMLCALGGLLPAIAGCTQFEDETAADTGQSDGAASEPTEQTETATATATDEQATTASM